MFCHDKRVCCNKSFVMTKIILVAAPTNDSLQHCTGRPVAAVSLATQLPCAFYFSFAAFAAPHWEICSGSKLGHPLHVTFTWGWDASRNVYVCVHECVYVCECMCVRECVCV